MNPKLEAKLFKEYEWLRPTDGFGLCVGDGWYGLINLLAGQIHHAIRFENECISDYKEASKDGKIPDWSWKPNDEPFDYPRVDQVKEKFGGLRFYGSTPAGTRYELRGYIQFAEAISFIICEVCGNKGEPRRSHSWIRTLCDKCESERKK